ncbi:plastocyanin [Mycolicibacterium moriokaense]|nr:plastocyanin [Mycolicibacterium moriokaense]
MKKIGMFLAAGALLVGVVTACGGSGGTSEATTTAAASSGAATSDNTPTANAGATITIENMSFGDPLTVAPGAKISIANNDSVEHSVTSNTAGLFDQDVEGHMKAMMTAPSQPGEYPFHCSYHPSMKGTLIVK